MRNIGIFGGSFDPVHNAHLALARAAREAFALDELRVIPAGQPWQKVRAITPAVHRVAMLELALAGDSGIVIDRREIDRAGPSYTLDTVRELQFEMTQAQTQAPTQSRCFLIIGQDQYATLHTWHGWRELLSRVTLAVARRPDAALSVDAEVASHAPRIVPLPMLPISSTDIRARVAAGLPIAHLVSPAVASYIDQQALYRASHHAKPGN